MPMSVPDEIGGHTEVLIRYNKERVEVTFTLDGEVYGNLTAERNKSVIKDRYSNAYEVTWSQANDGYGPFIYDVAMEFVTRNGGSLTSDKTTSISRDALSVWKHYLSCRRDVRSYLLHHPDMKVYDDARDYHYRKADGVWLERLESYGQLRLERLEEVDDMCFPDLGLAIDGMDDDEFCDELNERFGDKVFKLNMFDNPQASMLYDGDVGRGRGRPEWSDALFALKRMTGEDD